MRAGSVRCRSFEDRGCRDGTGDPFSPLLDLDPDLGRLLPAERVREARAELGVRMTFIERGVWDADRLWDVGPEHLGLLMLDGVIAREVLLADTTSIELVGAGDVLRPWCGANWR